MDSDYGLLSKITKVEHIPEDSSDNFSIVFHFSENDFFENEILVCTFHVNSMNEPMFTECPTVYWKSGRNMFKKTVTKQ